MPDEIWEKQYAILQENASTQMPPTSYLNEVSAIINIRRRSSVILPKNQVGLGDYQVRSWDGFHKHMAISMLALNFIMEQKAVFRRALPHITTEDIRSFIEFLLPDRIQTIEQKIDALLKKHKHYQRQIAQRRKPRA